MGRGYMAVGIVVLCLAAALDARAADPEAALVPATADGLNASMLEIVDSTLISKIESIGYETVHASSVSQAKSMGVDKIITTHLVRTGDEVIVRLGIIDAKTGAVAKASATTSTSGVLADVVKLIKKKLPEPVAKPVAPVEKPAPKTAPPAPVVKKPEPVLEKAEPSTGKEFQLVHGVWEDMYRSSTALLAAGTVTTLVGVGFTITAAVLWKRLEDYQDWAEDNACRECITKARDKMKVNLAITGVGIGLLLPGIFVLVSGIGKRTKALKLRDEMARLVPDMNLAISPRGQGGELTLTWTF